MNALAFMLLKSCRTHKACYWTLIRASAETISPWRETLAESAQKYRRKAESNLQSARLSINT